MKKRNILSKGLSLMLVLMMFISFLQVPASAAEKGTYSAMASALEQAYSGQEEEGNYTVSNASQLVKLAEKVNAGTSYKGSTFILLNNI